MANTSQDMETFTKSLASLNVGFSSSDSTNHASLYKQKQTRSSLDERRSQFLADQKNKRFDYMNVVRQLTETDWYEDEIETMDYRMSYERRYFHKDQLMLSQWMTEMPIDFQDEWLCVPCPTGKRCIVVASRGKTSSWSKAGIHIATFPSCFPGGNYQNIKDSTILDCLHSKALNTYYILDFMSWRGQPLYDSESEFRFYWMHTKIQEFPQILKLSKVNTSLFVPLTSHACTRSGIHEALVNPAFSVEMDGVLFYHRRTHYTIGTTPLVGWLKPFMLPEVLDVDIPEQMKVTKPPHYVDYKTYIEGFGEKHCRRKSGEMFKTSNTLKGSGGGEPIEREPYVPRDILMRGEKNKKKGNKTKTTESVIAMHVDEKGTGDAVVTKENTPKISENHSSATQIADKPSDVSRISESTSDVADSSMESNEAVADTSDMNSAALMENLEAGYGDVNHAIIENIISLCEDEDVLVKQSVLDTIAHDKESVGGMND